MIHVKVVPRHVFASYSLILVPLRRLFSVELVVSGPVCQRKHPHSCGKVSVCQIILVMCHVLRHACTLKKQS